MPVAVALLTGDLRLHDNPVLRAAVDSCDQIVPLFVLDTGIRDAGFAVPNRTAFLAGCLADLDASLRARGGCLVVRSGDVVEQVTAVTVATRADHVHVAAGPSRYASQRQQRLAAALARNGRRLHVHEGATTVVPPGAVTPAGKDHYAVFTPYLRRWSREPIRQPWEPPRRISVSDVGSDGVPTAASAIPGALSPSLPDGGERAGRQLAWRDFHIQVLAARRDAAWHDYRPRGDRWRAHAREVRVWKDGRTGYPIVDAAMRQLRHEGWMHNRCRMLVASFLTKTLYTDWRIGARYFLDMLVDGDLANNQLNWQWVAGTGTDTRPNRVLNPLTQARRFDPTGAYVRHWLPELASIDGPDVHSPWLLDRHTRGRLDYPAPIVDLDEGLARFRQGRGVD